MDGRSILLNQLPPTWWWDPDLAFPALAGHLDHVGIASRIVYWNVHLRHVLAGLIGLEPGLEERLFHRPGVNATRFVLAPYLHGLLTDSDEEPDRTALAALHAEWSALVPTHSTRTPDLARFVLPGALRHLDEAVERVLDDIDLDGVGLWGVSWKCSQWIPGMRVTAAARRRRPDLPVVLGGLVDGEHARSALRLWPAVDYAIVGEGEGPLEVLYRTLSSPQPDLDSVPRLLYRRDGQVIATGVEEPPPKELARARHVDFFDALEHTGLPARRTWAKDGSGWFTVESNRGCPWARCRFCALHQGYRCRDKPPTVVYDELVTLSRDQGVRRFHFGVQDLLGAQRANWEALLDLLIRARLDNTLVCTFSADIAPQRADGPLLERLRLAGFSHLLLGLEATSDSLLEKAGKQHRMADNLLFLALARRSGLAVHGNIIQGLPGETADDVIASTRNLHLLRFVLGAPNSFWVSPMRLELGSPAGRHPDLVGGHDRWTFDDGFTCHALLPARWKNAVPRLHLGSFTAAASHPEEWQIFERTLAGYRDAALDYEAFQLPEVTVLREISHGRVQRERRLEPLEWAVLECCNDEVLSPDELMVHLVGRHFPTGRPSGSQLDAALQRLTDDAWLYVSPDRQQIVSVIDTTRARRLRPTALARPTNDDGATTSGPTPVERSPGYARGQESTG